MAVTASQGDWPGREPSANMVLGASGLGTAGPLARARIILVERYLRGRIRQAGEEKGEASTAAPGETSELDPFATPTEFGVGVVTEVGPDGKGVVTGEESGREPSWSCMAAGEASGRFSSSVSVSRSTSAVQERRGVAEEAAFDPRLPRTLGDDLGFFDVTEPAAPAGATGTSAAGAGLCSKSRRLSRSVVSSSKEKFRGSVDCCCEGGLTGCREGLDVSPKLKSMEWRSRGGFLTQSEVTLEGSLMETPARSNLKSDSGDDDEGEVERELTCPRESSVGLAEFEFECGVATAVNEASRLVITWLLVDTSSSPCVSAGAVDVGVTRTGVEGPEFAFLRS